MKILVISPVFFGYENRIVSSIRRQFSFVKWVNDRPKDTFFMKFFLRAGWTKIVRQAVERHFEKNIFDDTNSYDKILFCNSEAITEKLFWKIKDRHPNSKLIFYTWDSVVNKPRNEFFFKNCDQSYSFDPVDCERFGIEYLPLFHNGIIKQHTTKKIDIFYTGTVHSDRLRYLGMFIDFAKQKGLRLKACLYIPHLVMLIRHFRDVRYFLFISTKSLNYGTYCNTLASSRVTIDIQHELQSGLTMRTFEALSCGCKLITTNSRIKDHEFYSSTNILILDDYVNEETLLNFIRSDFDWKKMKDFEKYGLDNWVKSILSE